MQDQDFSNYQNASTIGDISALVKESESKTAAANDYCKANQREESQAEALKSEAAGEDEEKEPLKPSNGEWSPTQAILSAAYITIYLLFCSSYLSK